MVDIVKQDMTYLWAVSGDVVAPDNTKIQEGWSVEAVPRQWWNWMQYRADSNIAYMLQKGLPEWDATTEYLANKSFVTSGGIVYKCLITNTNMAPLTNPTRWARAFTDFSNATNALTTLSPVNGSMVVYNSGTSASVFTTTAFGRGFLTRADAAAGRTYIDAQQADPNLTALTGVTAATNALPYFNSATTMTTTTLSAFGRTLIDDASAAAARVTLDVPSNADLTSGLAGVQAASQPLDATLTTLSDLTTSANTLPYFTGTDTATTTPLTAFGRSLIDDADAAAGRATLGLGTAATATLTTSTSDSTTGRVLKVGDFNIGATSNQVSVLDCDTVTATGIYGIVSGTVNGPIGASSGSTLIATAYSSVEQRQLVLFRTNPPRIAIRSLVSGTWSAWEELWTTASLKKTTTTTDTTAGSLLKVGDFGLGGIVAPPTITDLTANIPVGFYFVPAGSTGTPGTGGGYLTVTMYAHCTFVIGTVSTSSRKIYDGVRGSNTGAWTWTEVVHDGNLPAITNSITSDVTNNVQASIDLKQNISTLGVETSGSGEDPNTSLNVTFLTNHANGPVANGGANGFYHIQQQFYQSKADTNRSRSQIAVTYSTSTPQMWIRSGYTATPGSVAPTWYPWVRCDMGGNAATATKLATARTINGVSFDGTANINVPVYAAPGSASEVGKYLDFHETGSVADADVRLQSVPSGGTAPAAGYIGAGLAVGVGTASGNGSMYASQFVTNGGWFRSNGTVGWYNETYQGGIYMTDTTWVRTYNGKGFHADGGLSTSGNLNVSGVITGNGAGITNVVSVPTEIVRNSSIVEFSGIYLTGANVSTCDVPDPYVMVGMRTGANGPHGWAWLRATTFRTRA